MNDIFRETTFINEMRYVDIYSSFYDNRVIWNSVDTMKWGFLHTPSRNFYFENPLADFTLNVTGHTGGAKAFTVSLDPTSVNFIIGVAAEFMLFEILLIIV